MQIEKNEIDWLNSNQPGLVIDHDNGSQTTLKGCFSFSAVYDESSNVYIINPAPGSYKHPIISDKYNIEIFAFKDQNSPPLVKNTDGRLLELAKKQNKDSRDLHVYSDIQRINYLCVLGPLDQELIKGNISLSSFIDRVLVPFFYDNSYYEKFGIRPREDYSHEMWGVIENYYDLTDPSQEIDSLCLAKLQKHPRDWEKIKHYISGKKVLKGHHMCMVCGNGKIRECHIKVFRGINCLSERILKLSNQF